MRISARGAESTSLTSGPAEGVLVTTDSKGRLRISKQERVSVLTIDAFEGRGPSSAMPRKLRVEYPGSIYHVMNRGDRREGWAENGAADAAKRRSEKSRHGMPTTTRIDYEPEMDSATTADGKLDLRLQPASAEEWGLGLYRLFDN